MSSPVLRVVAKLMLPFVLMFALYLLLRGHLSPGGGFIAGVMVAAVLSLQYVAFPQQEIKRLLNLDLRLIIAVGLALAAGTGTAAVFFGQPFLTSGFEHFYLPLMGEFEISSAFFFDVGIFLVVVATILMMISSIMLES
jgi:multisubunit Na+/H+ antiporter MnhB subunit